MSRGISNQAIYNYNMVTYEDDNKSVCLNLDPDLTKMSDFILTSSLSEKVQKRVDYIEWDEYFMAMTFLELQRNSHKHKNDAAIILNKRKIIISMATSNILEETNMKTETTPAAHAEYKSLQKVGQGSAVMYTTTFPCEKCAEAISEAGITEIIYYYDKSDSVKAKNIFKENRIIYRQFTSKKKQVKIDFKRFCDSLS